MTKKEFNTKWAEFIEEGFKGMEIDEPLTISYLNGLMPYLTTLKGFKLFQVKHKFNFFRVYFEIDDYSLQKDLEKIIDKTINFLLSKNGVTK